VKSENYRIEAVVSKLHHLYKFFKEIFWPFMARIVHMPSTRVGPAFELGTSSPSFNRVWKSDLERVFHHTGLKQVFFSHFSSNFHTETIF
jgi:hypothetical protein